jgi:hypothetical protein
MTVAARVESPSQEKAKNGTATDTQRRKDKIAERLPERFPI